MLGSADSSVVPFSSCGRAREALNIGSPRMPRRSRLKALALFCLVFTWLVASLAPSLLVHLSVRSRILVAAAQTQVPMSSVTRALMRGQLCGVSSEVARAEQDLPEGQPAAATETETAKVVLCLVDPQLVHSVPSGQDNPIIPTEALVSAEPISPLDPPPRRV